MNKEIVEAIVVTVMVVAFLVFYYAMSSINCSLM